MSKVYEALRKAEWERDTRRRSPELPEVSVEMVPHIPPEAWEAHGRIWENIGVASLDRPVQVILVTGSVPGEGSSTVAAHLALYAAGGDGGQEAEEVLLVDGNLRTPKIHELFGLSNASGLVDLIRNGRAPEGVIRATDREHLYVVPCGGLASNPTHLLGSERMKALLDGFRERFGHVILDVPPVTSYADAVAVSRYVDGVVIVVRTGKTSEKRIQQSRTRLEEAGARILGVVLNRAR